MPASGEIFDILRIDMNNPTNQIPYHRYREIAALFDQMKPPDAAMMDVTYSRARDMVKASIGGDIPDDVRVIHQRVETLLQHGYAVEEVTPGEYAQLKALFDACVEADIDDTELHPEGSHRALYTYLTRGIGLFVEAARGATWHRAKVLIETHQ